MEVVKTIVGWSLARGLSTFFPLSSILPELEALAGHDSVINRYGYPYPACKELVGKFTGFRIAQRQIDVTLHNRQVTSFGKSHRPRTAFEPVQISFD
jgi:hypothetical protein